MSFALPFDYITEDYLVEPVASQGLPTELGELEKWNNIVFRKFPYNCNARHNFVSNFYPSH